ncbi:MAG: energy transducer TonB [Bacteroidia bacterium]|nr:energy transducer TonB [Bacteroidia bacterium]
MKNNTITLLLLLLFLNGISQNAKNKNFSFEYKGRNTASANEEKLNSAKSVCDITPELWQKLLLPYTERIDLDKLRKIGNSQEFYIAPQENNYNNCINNNYNKIVEYVSVEISTFSNGKKKFTGLSSNENLTPEQKNILNTAEPGTDIYIKIRFRHKNQAMNTIGADNKIIEGELSVTIVPEQEAEFPGGFKQFSKYITENIFNKVSGKENSEKITWAAVSFTINEEGRVVDAKVSGTSGDLKIDQLIILEAINKMPKWKPAQNSKGEKVKEEFSIPFGNGGC